MLHNSTRRKGSRLPVRAERTINLFFALSRLARVIISLARFFCLKNARQFVWDLGCLSEIVSDSTFKAFNKQAGEKRKKKNYADILHQEQKAVCVIHTSRFTERKKANSEKSRTEVVLSRVLLFRHRHFYQYTVPSLFVIYTALQSRVLLFANVFVGC